MAKKKLNPNITELDLSLSGGGFRATIFHLDGTDEVMSTTIAEFAKIDEKSFSFRYPVNQQGKKIPIGH